MSHSDAPLEAFTAEETCDLCIIGAGYAGINALNAATLHLPKKARVVVVDREACWGGQWVRQYEFVRLHQPYRNFTAGTRDWDLKKPHSHLASKKEIIRHFENIAAACVEEKSLDLVTLFEYLYVTHTISSSGQVEITAKSVNADAGLPIMKIVAKKMINSIGFDISIKAPIKFSGTNRVHSLCPADVGTPEWNVKMQYSEDKDKPIYVIGSGKTAIDAIIHLSKTLGESSHRIKCISGQGTFFIVREKMAPTDWWERNMYGSKTAIDWFIQMFDMYDGSNSKEVLQELTRQGFLHHAIPNPGSFVLGICSLEEIALVKTILSPPEEKLLQAYLEDIVDEGSGLAFKLRALDGTAFSKSVEAGSFIVNCTSHVANPSEVYPVLSEDGLVLSPQAICGFSGPSANICTHLFYLGGLDQLWRQLPRVEIDWSDKAKNGIQIAMLVLISNTIMANALPASIRNKFVQPPDMPLHRLVLAGMRLQRALPRLQKKLELLDLRFPDKKVTWEELQRNLASAPVSRL
eukprot:gnl/MRDRNA2_/MRDRNA2_172699_c0_seq1.p1 gnl/MRDRNA2_/MRDRNA2_172699_c0~~gnl/MRDRNA2_/MRDRNA2_172699_c0_seq1.p1  ORF type:complete len:520 (+),score=85.23 gnl/MRDRNA2_/MRDRNA2_172699_c0_seq1:178-1737(+)